MRVLVVGSCGKKKLYNGIEQPACHEIDTKRNLVFWKKKMSEFCVPAREMYLGPQNTELVKAVDLLRTINNVKVQYIIVSAGFGILREDELVPPYDCSFSKMPMKQVRARSQELKIQASLINKANKEYDLAYLALSKRYLAALGKDTLCNLEMPIIVFDGQGSDSLIRLPCSAQTVRAFSKQGHKIHGVVGFKGDLFRILVTYALKRADPIKEVNRWKNPTHLKKLVYRLGGLT